MPDGTLSMDCTTSIRAIAAALRTTKRWAERRAAKESWPFVELAVRGGKQRLYDVGKLPTDVQAALLLRDDKRAPRSAPVRHSDAHVATVWQRYARLPDRIKAIAVRRLNALHVLEQLVAGGLGRVAARATVAEQLVRKGERGASAATVARWEQLVRGVERHHWVAFLAPRYVGRTATAEIPADAWDIYKADFLRLEQPTAMSCFERLQRIAKARGWSLPSWRTFDRKLEREVPRTVRILAREGEEALMRLYPAQERDRSVFHALEAVNADGHRFDFFVRWPDDSVARPVVVPFQDLMSGKILAYRVGQTESSDLARLAFRDLVEKYGVPSHAWLDNGRGFASKMLTGGTPTRYRFKVRAEDPIGIFVQLGVKVHWATPYHGQAKPIERAFRDWCDRIAKHPAFAGAYTGNSPTAKPENYGSHAVPYETFLRVLDEEVVAHNAREGRRTKVCAGRSFDATFAESYARAPIRKATSEQLNTMLLAAETVTADARDGSVRLAGNRYWTEALSPHASERVIVRFDPDALHGTVQVYALDGTYIAEADCIASVGFADTQAAREHARGRSEFRRGVKQQLKGERRMSAAQVADQLPKGEVPPVPPAKVIKPIFSATPRAPEDTQPSELDLSLYELMKKRKAEQF
jgi:hypothetical protein